MRKILTEAGIAFTEVGGARLFDTALLPKGMEGRERVAALPQKLSAENVVEYDKTRRPATWYKQHIIAHVPNASMQRVIDLVRSGAFAKFGLYLHDFDVTIDLRGSFSKNTMVRYLLTQPGWRIQSGRLFADRTILDNSHKVGENCLVWMVTVPISGRSYNVRLKFYLKLVQEFEKAAVRK